MAKRQEDVAELNDLIQAAHKASDKIGHATDAVMNKGAELGHGARADVAMDHAKNPNLPMTDRLSEGATGVKERVQEVIYIHHNPHHYH
jgi:hypothetical protein